MTTTQQKPKMYIDSDKKLVIKTEKEGEWISIERGVQIIQ